MIETKLENPWDVQSLYEFLFFNCPSCTFKHTSKEDFLVHSFNIHTESVDYLRNISDGSISDVAVPWLGNDFKSHEIINDNESKNELEDGHYDDFIKMSSEISNIDKSEEITDENVDKNSYFDQEDEKKIDLKGNANPSVVLTGIEPLHCMECDEYFASTKYLQIHVRQFHETKSRDLESNLILDPLESLSGNEFDDYGQCSHLNQSLEEVDNILSLIHI